MNRLFELGFCLSSASPLTILAGGSAFYSEALFYDTTTAVSEKIPEMIRRLTYISDTVSKS